MASILAAAHYECFSKSCQFMCIYNRKENKCIEVNQCMRDRMQGMPVKDITVIASDDVAIYATLSGIPCNMTLLFVVEGDICIMEMFPAHTKTWTQSSDLVELTNLTSDGVWEWYPTVNFEYMSKRFWSILGYDQDEMDETPMAWMEFLNADDKQPTMDMYEAHVKSKGEVPYHGHVRYTHKDGREVIVLCRGSVVEWLPDGTPWRMIGTHTDVTTIVKKDAIEAQSVFISRMSHEIRSPICTILNECELLGMNARTKVIQDTCTQLISITDDILNLGESGPTDLQLKPEVSDVYAVLSKCSKRHKIEAKKKKIAIKVSMGDVPDTLLIDVGKFNQIIDNLVSNAIKYSRKGTVKISAEYNSEESKMQVMVSDQGQGIPSNMHTKIFEEFVQGDKTMQGAGIGLTLARRFARLMDGDVTIESSREGLGTRMLFTAILKEPVYSTTEDHLVILVVDDMQTNREILNRRLQNLQKAGIHPTEIIEAENGRLAVDTFSARNGDVQLVLMDCLMPIMDGFSATLELHTECQKLGLEPVPVVAITASVDTTVRKRCNEHGMRYVVTKPYSEDELLASITACLKRPT